MKTTVANTDYAEISHDHDLKTGFIVWKRKTTSEEYQYAFITLLVLLLI